MDRSIDLQGPERPTATVDMQRIAVWMQLQAGQPLTGEGIGNYTQRLIGEWTRTFGIEVVVYAPRWAGPALTPYLAACGAPPGKLSVSYHGSAWLQAIEMFHNRRRVESEKLLGAPRLRRAARQDLLELASPATSEGPHAALRFSRRVLSFLYWRTIGVAVRVIRPLIERERERVYATMAAGIDATPEIGMCYVPIGVWSGARLVKIKPLVLHLPDVVMVEFPEMFSPSAGIDELIARIRELAAVADRITCASQHVRQRHHIEFLQLDERKSHMLAHAPMVLSDEPAAALDEGRAERRRLLKEAIASELGRPLPAATTLIYFPTQNRPYKNIVAILHAMTLMRSAHPILLLTADVSADREFGRQIFELGLADRVLTTGRLSREAHAELFASVDIGITSSRFEGGFPFTFAEGVSSGAPVVMAAIPVTVPVIPAELAPRMLFDPLSPPDIARALDAALADRGLLQHQRQLLARMMRRSWSDLAGEYLELGRAARAERAALPAA
jgi:hypothetical protein